MGNFYTNIVLKGVSQQRAKTLLEKMNRTAFISPTHETITVVYDSNCEAQDQEEICSLASELSRQLKSPAWAVLNHDDDILWFVLYFCGELVD